MADAAKDETATPIRSPLRIGEANEPIILHRGDAVVRQGEISVAGIATVAIEWLPTFRIAVRVEAETSLPPDLGIADLELAELGGSGRRFPLEINGTNAWSSGGRSGLTIVGTTEFIYWVDEANSPLDRLVFHVPNWPVLYADPIRDPAGGGWAGRITMRDLRWSVRLETERGATEHLRQLKEVGGYAITMLGEIRRVDDQSFSLAEVADVVRGLSRFLSFGRGIWTSALCLVGNSDEAPVYYEANRLHTLSWRANHGWFTPYAPESLAEAFPGFMARWRDPRWRNSLDLGVGLFMEANAAKFAEMSILAAQSLLEMFSWIVRVEERGLISRKTFKKRENADTSVRELLRWGQIPLEIPHELSALDEYADGAGWSDGPNALVTFRNMLTHPRGRAGTIYAIPTRVRMELGQLAILYSELVILRFCGFRGMYLDRVRAQTQRDFTPVPWA
jgi:hypothetical protein